MNLKFYFLGIMSLVLIQSVSAQNQNRSYRFDCKGVDYDFTIRDLRNGVETELNVVDKKTGTSVYKDIVFKTDRNWAVSYNSNPNDEHNVVAAQVVLSPHQDPMHPGKLQGNLSATLGIDTDDPQDIDELAYCIRR